MTSEARDPVEAATRRVRDEQESNARATAGTGPAADDQADEFAELAEEADPTDTP
jgi:hypothetical protein